MRTFPRLFPILSAVLLAAGFAAAQGRPYELVKDVQYGEAKGVPLLLNVYKPTGQNRNPVFKPGEPGKGPAVIDVISGGWNSSPAREGEHAAAGMFDVVCARGYTVFAVRVGSVPDFDGLEITENLQRGVRWVKAHAAEYGINPDRIGMVGASAGGHLSLLSMVRGKPGDPKAEDPLLRFSTGVAAVAVFFPPTHFLSWNGARAPIDLEPGLLFTGGVAGKTEAELDARLRELSPALQVTPGLPPALLVHGDSDPVVPLDQSEQMMKALKDAGNDAELVVKKDGGHFWLTITEEIILITDWLDKKLAGVK